MGGGGGGRSMYLEVLLMNGIDDVFIWSQSHLVKCTQVTLLSGTESSWSNCMVRHFIMKVNIYYI